jgi:hypothetical protein
VKKVVIPKKKPIFFSPPAAKSLKKTAVRENAGFKGKSAKRGKKVK